MVANILCAHGPAVSQPCLQRSGFALYCTLLFSPRCFLSHKPTWLDQEEWSTLPVTGSKSTLTVSDSLSHSLHPFSCHHTHCNVNLTRLTVTTVLVGQHPLFLVSNVQFLNIPCSTAPQSVTPSQGTTSQVRADTHTDEYATTQPLLCLRCTQDLG